MSAVALAIVAVVVFRMVPGRVGTVAAALLIGGAVGNLIDRAIQGGVTDFLDLPLLPPCNIADIAITFGALTMAAGLLFAGQEESKEHESSDPA